MKDYTSHEYQLSCPHWNICLVCFATCVTKWTTRVNFCSCDLSFVPCGLKYLCKLFLALAIFIFVRINWTSPLPKYNALISKDNDLMSFDNLMSVVCCAAQTIYRYHFLQQEMVIFAVQGVTEISCVYPTTCLKNINILARNINKLLFFSKPNVKFWNVLFESAGLECNAGVKKVITFFPPFFAFPKTQSVLVATRG